MSDRTDGAINRRRVLAGLAGAGVVALGAAAVPASAAPSTAAPGAGRPAAPPAGAGKPGRRETLVPAQTSWELPPPMTGGPTTVRVRDADLEVWDTRGKGSAIVLQHPHSGHGGVWGYQQAAFAKAGHRVISYSRRGYGGSTGFTTAAGTDLRDLEALMDLLGVGQFHLVGIAAGANVVLDAALRLPERVLTAMPGCSIFGIAEDSWNAVNARMTGGGFRTVTDPATGTVTRTGLDPEFQELGPSYRAAAPAEVLSAWHQNEAQPNPPTPLPGTEQPLRWADLEKITTPTMLFTGDADMYLPPSRLREVASHMPSARMTLFAEVGHSPHWEAYRPFNDMVLSFAHEHRPR